jgi:hypothetical protein
MPSANQTIADALSSAQSILAQWVPTEGISAEQALGDLVGVLDNRTLLAAQRVQAGECHKGLDRDLLTRRSKVTFDLLRKYGVLVDPDSLSEEVVERLHPRINYPRLSYGQTLREWSDTVLGEGEQVLFFLPQAPKRNTHLSTVQFLSHDAKAFIDELVTVAQTGGDSEAQATIETQEETFVLDLSKAEQTGFDKEAEAITSGGQRGVNTLRALMDVAEEDKCWSPAVVECIGKLLEIHDGEEEADTLEVMTQLVDRFDLMVRKAREVLEKAKAQPV